jgi:hypothetical protein
MLNQANARLPIFQKVGGFEAFAVQRSPGQWQIEI